MAIEEGESALGSANNQPMLRVFCTFVDDTQLRAHVENIISLLTRAGSEHVLLSEISTLLHLLNSLNHLISD